ncbi:hypothetical protein AAVH_32743, partial [Aphelenchoides avenae]
VPDYRPPPPQTRGPQPPQPEPTAFGGDYATPGRYQPPAQRPEVYPVGEQTSPPVSFRAPPENGPKVSFYSPNRGGRPSPVLLVGNYPGGPTPSPYDFETSTFPHATRYSPPNPPTLPPYTAAPPESYPPRENPYAERPGPTPPEYTPQPPKGPPVATIYPPPPQQYTPQPGRPGIPQRGRPGQPP